MEHLSLLSGSVFWSRFLHEIRKHIWRLFEININCCKWDKFLAFEKLCKLREGLLITCLLFYQIFYNWNIGSYLLLSSNKMESKRCGYTLFGGIVVILALCSISTVRGDDWDDELEFATDKSEARLLNLNSTSLPDSYVSHFWFKALSIGFWSNVVHTKISLHESSTCVYG